MRPVRVLGVSGKARHGKDSVAAILREEYPYGKVGRIAFADAVREEARRPGPNGEAPAWDGTVPYTPEGRTALQRVGMARRAEDPDYWIKKCFSEMAKSGHIALWVIPDVRFVNEADSIRGIGGRIWRIERMNPDGTPFDSGMTNEQKAHASEIELDGYEYFDRVLSASTQLGLRAQVRASIPSLGSADPLLGGSRR